MYVTKPTILPLCNICRLSFAKVENVVKPPQKPVASNKHSGLFSELYFPNRANINPNRKQPNKFTVNVAQGKP